MLLNVQLGPFSVQVSHLLLLLSLLVAAGVGRWVGRHHKTTIGHVLLDMFWVGLLGARLAFVVSWFESYRSAPWTLLDIRDGGFTPWVGLLAAACLAGWRGWQQPAMRKPLLWGLTAGAVAWGAMSVVAGNLGSGAKPILPSVTLLTLTGESTTLAEVAKGQPLVVNLWASWCPPCRREMPVLAAAQEQEKEITFVFANQGEDASTALRYLQASQLDLRNVLFDAGALLGHAIGSTALPTTLFYDANGQLVNVHLGELSKASLANQLAALHSK
ncbi:MAG: TlpA disulfide reductase family protein [Polaromonas sp.]|nr:TlpA disulfide reductase family protein [Polaromonas sp.]